MGRVLPLDGCVGDDPLSQRVALVRASVPDDAEAGTLAELFRLLGDVLSDAVTCCPVPRGGTVPP